MKNDPKKIVQNRLAEVAGEELPPDPTFGQVRQAEKAKKDRITNLSADDKRKVLAYADAQVAQEGGPDFSTLYDWFLTGLPGHESKPDEEIQAEWEERFGQDGMYPEGYVEEIIRDALDTRE